MDRSPRLADNSVDLLVEFFHDSEVDLLDHAGLMMDLADPLGRGQLGLEERLEIANMDSILERLGALPARNSTVCPRKTPNATVPVLQTA